MKDGIIYTTHLPIVSASSRRRPWDTLKSSNKSKQVSEPWVICVMGLRYLPLKRFPPNQYNGGKWNFVLDKLDVISGKSSCCSDFRYSPQQKHNSISHKVKHVRQPVFTFSSSSLFLIYEISSQNISIIHIVYIIYNIKHIVCYCLYCNIILSCLHYIL